MTDTGDRLLSFEIAGKLFAMPIAGVLEVADLTERSCIPTLPPSVAWVVNYRGDALPVVRREKLLDLGDEVPQGKSEHVLVLTDDRGGGAHMGLVVDRVLGFLEGAATPARGRNPVSERRPAQGRLAHILDPARLVARARAVIEDLPTGD